MTAFPDIEAKAIALLDQVAGGVHVGTEVPTPRPESYVHARVTGGSALQRVYERPTITVTCEAPGTVASSALAGTCREKFLDVFGADAELTRPYLDPDPDTNNPRYTFVFRTRNRATD